MLNKKADGGIVAIIIVIIIVLFVLGLVSYGNRECSRDSDCGEFQYCGADHGCHSFEVKETRIQEKAPTKPYWILATIIVAGAVAVKLTREL